MPRVGHWPTKLRLFMSLWLNVRSPGNVGVCASIKTARGTSLVPVVKDRLKEKKSLNSIPRGKKTVFKPRFRSPGSGSLQSESNAVLTPPVRSLGTAALSGLSRFAVAPPTLSSSTILPTCKHTTCVQCSVQKSLVMHNSAQTGYPLPTEFSKSCDVSVSLCESPSVDEYPPLVSSSQVSIRSASPVFARSFVGGGVGVELGVVGVGGGVGRVGLVVVVHGAGWKVGFSPVFHSLNRLEHGRIHASLHLEVKNSCANTGHERAPSKVRLSSKIGKGCTLHDQRQVSRKRLARSSGAGALAAACLWIPCSPVMPPGRHQSAPQSLSWARVCGTEKSGVWVLKGGARTKSRPRNPDDVGVVWEPRSGYETAWATPGHVCSCSNSYGPGAVLPQSNPSVFTEVDNLWSRVSSLLTPWCDS